MYKLITPIALAASSVLANPILTHNPSMVPGIDNTGAFCAVVLDISGYESIDNQGSPNNQIAEFFVGPFQDIFAIEWDVNLTTIGGSWAEEAAISFGGGDVVLTPGFRDSFPVTNANYSSDGIVNLQDQGLPNILVGSDGYLRLEFFETFDDAEGETDAIWLDGSTITVYTPLWPTPGTTSALAFAGLIASRRRR
jgi:hypothetical protein